MCVPGEVRVKDDERVKGCGDLEFEVMLKSSFTVKGGDVAPCTTKTLYEEQEEVNHPLTCENF